MAFSLRMQRCCCCCTVHTGSIIIGTLGWIYTLASLFAFISPGSSSNIQPKNEEQQYIKDFLESMDNNSFGARIGYAVIDLIVCILLIWGIYKKDQRFMLPYLIVQCIKCIALTIITIVIFVFFFLVPSDYIVLVVLVFVFFLITTLLSWYFWLCVWSHYKDLGEHGPHATVYYSPTSVPAQTEKDRPQAV